MNSADSIPIGLVPFTTHVKTAVSVYADAETVEATKELSFNISKLCEIA